MVNNGGILIAPPRGDSDINSITKYRQAWKAHYLALLLSYQHAINSCLTSISRRRVIPKTLLAASTINTEPRESSEKIHP